MGRTRIKICGITRAEDARLAVELGADAVGLNFARVSKRRVEVNEAREIARHVPPLVTCVGLFVDPAAEDVRAVLDEIPLQLLQFHGAEDARFCASFGVPYIQTIRVAPLLDWERELERTRGAAALLLDTFAEASAGGTGRVFDWSLIPDDLEQKIILAGGLDAANVAAAIRAVRPFAVDVSSGVERSPGIKDAERMRAFFAEVGAIEHE